MNEFILTIQSSLHFVPKGAHDDKSQSVRAMDWRHADTKLLPEALMRLWGSLS